MINHKKLLKKYIAHVKEKSCDDFLHNLRTELSYVDISFIKEGDLIFTQEEVKELKKIGEYPEVYNKPLQQADSRTCTYLYPKYNIDEWQKLDGSKELHVICGFRKKMYDKYYIFTTRHANHDTDMVKIKRILKSLSKHIKGFEKSLDSGAYQKKGMYTEEDMVFRPEMLDLYQGE